MRLRTIAEARQLLGFALAVVLIHSAGRADAAGTVDLSWDACSPILSERMRDGAHPYSLYASVLGHDTPHKAYQVFFLAESNLGPGGPFAPYPDAWRFDFPGCQTSALLRIDHLAPAAVAKVCPSFVGPISSVLTVKDFSFDAVTGRARGVVAVSYPSGSTTTTNPAQRYFLTRFEFDHTFSVVGPGTPGETCGGFETHLRFRLTNATWLDMNNVEQSFFFGATPAIFCGSCTPTPAVSATWGAIKGQYRR